MTNISLVLAAAASLVLGCGTDGGRVGVDLSEPAMLPDGTPTVFPVARECQTFAPGVDEGGVGIGTLMIDTRGDEQLITVDVFDQKTLLLHREYVADQTTGPVLEQHELMANGRRYFLALTPGACLSNDGS